MIGIAPPPTEMTPASLSGGSPASPASGAKMSAEQASAVAVMHVRSLAFWNSAPIDVELAD